MTDTKTGQLTDRMRAFAESYVVSWNATQAAKQAGYSEHTAKSQGSRLLRHPTVAGAISERMRSLHMTADEALARLADHARGSMESFVNENGVVDLNVARAHGKLHLIRRIKTTVYHNHRDQTTTETTELELYSAADALSLIGRNQRLFGAEVNVTLDWRSEAKDAGKAVGVEVDVDALLARAVAELRASFTTPKQLPPGDGGTVVDAVIINERAKQT